MDMEQEAEALLLRIRLLREAPDAGQLTQAQVSLYRDLGRKVEQITRKMAAAPDAETAERLWTQGAELIQTYLDEHFALPTVH
ncbi:hypothetical protein [Caulobacter endophyticus]|uniref:Uncharacterized protein n=1 Tax=Caulobacter endophyticus TaxID=2172652 RepID=A0A2T9JI77_9CAUL|nr:hypothetical protein [Caulobacter endophyticus]PVM83397.1 hypothetical protein DDF67_20890 [Caulobacter endophyticus]